MVHFDGLDVTKEIIYLVGVPGALAERGIATLVVDNPGVGESLRMRGLHNGPEAEIPAKAASRLSAIDARHRSLTASASWRCRSAAIMRRESPRSSRV